MRGWSSALSTLMSLALVLAVAYGVLALAARHYAPSASSPITGASASAINGWVLVAPGQPKPVNPPLDLARQAGLGDVQLVGAAALNSAILLVLALSLALGIGVPLGFWVGVSGPHVVADMVRATTSIGITFPAFFLAFLLQLVAIAFAQLFQRTIVPVFGYGIDGHLVLPTIALALAPLAYVMRLVALAAEDLEHRDFVRTARAKGLSEGLVIYRHIATNMVATLAEAALGAARLALGGLVIVEFVLVWPGLGLLTLRAANVQDFSVFLSAVFVFATVFLAVEISIDALTRPHAEVPA
jgi:peptide/nickel transport system permease protein